MSRTLPPYPNGWFRVVDSRAVARGAVRPLRYFGQELNWSTYAIARINVILHGLEADIRGGKSTITDPQFLKPDGSVEKFDMVLANFPFSDETWWLAAEQQTEEQIKKARKAFSKEGFKDKYHRFPFGTPPASYGDYAYIQHIVASMSDTRDEGDRGARGALLPDDRTSGYRERWDGIQSRFVDDPRSSVEQADKLVIEIVQDLQTTFGSERQALENQWQSGDDVQTEDLRVALQRYRTFFDRLLAA